MDNQEKSYKIPLLIGGLVLIITVGAGGLILTLTQKTNTVVNNTSNSITQPTNTTTQNSTSNLTTSTTNITNQNSKYKDGTYTSSGSYETPGGEESIAVTLKVQNGLISSVSVDNGTASSFDSERYQSRFKQGVSGAVVGKTLDTATLGRVNGSSLTPHGFNAALAKIKTQAAV